MKLVLKSRSIFLPMILCVAGAAPLVMCAQNDGSDGPPKVLVIYREFTKPGKEGGAHHKTESAFISAMKANHGQLKLLALTSLSGANRTVFFTGYPTFAAWEAAEIGLRNNQPLMEAMDSANLADGDLLASRDESVWVRRDDLSLNSTKLMGARYMQISQYIIRPGHVKEWEDLVKMMMDGYKKGIPAARWTMWSQRYGNLGNAYLVTIPVKSGSEVDTMAGSSKAFSDAMGEDGMRKMEALQASCVESRQTNLFAIDPKMSIPRDEWVKAEPDFWNSKQ
jgi:hypothetical protein